MSKPLSLIVLISGGGSNLQSIIDQCENGKIKAKIQCVISNKANVYGLERAKKANIPTIVVDHTQFSSREVFDQSLMQTIDEYQPDLVILAGFMRILTPNFVEHYSGKMLNIHPSLLPKFRGIHTHERVIAAQEKQHGASVHFVTAELDGGPIIIQAVVPILENDTVDELAKRVLTQEHIIYPKVIAYYADKRLYLNADQIIFDGKVLNRPLTL